LLLIVPQTKPLQPTPDTIHATAVFDVPVTTARNCFAASAATDALAGLTMTVTFGKIVMFAAADLLGSATLVAITLTIAGEGGKDGAE
jgi:hypothetical protein